MLRLTGGRQVRSLPRSAGVILLVVMVQVAGCAGHGPRREVAPPAAAGFVDSPRGRMAYHYFSEGALRAGAGEHDAAARAFERALELDPASQEIRLALADAYLSLRQYDRAAAVAGAADSNDVRTWRILGRCYGAVGSEEDARRAYRRVVVIDSTDTGAWWYLSRLAMRRNQLEEAVGCLEWLKRLRADFRIANEIGELYVRNGRYEDAFGAYRESLRYDSSAANREAYLGMAISLEPLGRYDEAAAAYRRAVVLAPDDITVRKRLMHLYLAHSPRDSAIAVIEGILAIKPDDPERLRLGMLWYETNQPLRAESLFVRIVDSVHPYIPLFYLGRIAADRNDYAAAKGYFRRAVALGDSIPDAWLHLGYVLLNQDSAAAAIAAAHAAIAAVGAEPLFWHFIGITFNRQKQYDSAVVWLRRAYETDTTDGHVQFSLGAALERAKRFEDAAAMFSSLIAREPDNATALNYLGYMYADSGVHLNEALELIKRALAVEPDNGAFLDSYGWVLFRLGRLEAAEVEIRKALEVLQSDPTIHEHLGDILAARGKREDALASWRRALELDPDNEAVRRKLSE